MMKDRDMDSDWGDNDQDKDGIGGGMCGSVKVSIDGENK